MIKVEYDSSYLGTNFKMFDSYDKLNAWLENQYHVVDMMLDGFFKITKIEVKK